MHTLAFIPINLYGRMPSIDQIFFGIIMIRYIVNGFVSLVLVLLIKPSFATINIVETDLKSSFLLLDESVCQEKAGEVKGIIEKQDEWYKVLGALRNCEKGSLNNEDLGKFGKEILAQLSSSKDDEQTKQQAPQLWLGFLKYMDKHVKAIKTNKYEDCDACIIWDTVFRNVDASGDSELDDVKRSLLIDLAIVMAEPPLKLVFANVQLTPKFRQLLRTITFSLEKEFSLNLLTKGKVASESLAGSGDGAPEKIKGEVFQGNIASYKDFLVKARGIIPEYPESAYLITDDDRKIFITRLMELATSDLLGIRKLEKYFNTSDTQFIFETSDNVNEDVSKLTLFLPDSKLIKDTKGKDYIIAAYAKYIQLILSGATTESGTSHNSINETKRLKETFEGPTLNQKENLCQAYILPNLQNRLRILGSLPNYTNRLDSLREYFANICMDFIDTSKIPENVPFVDEEVLRSEEDNTKLYLELLKNASSTSSNTKIGPILEKLDSVKKVASFYDFIKEDKILTGLDVLESLLDDNENLFNKSANTKGFRYLLRRILQSKAKEDFCEKHLLKLCGKEQGRCKGFIENSLRDLIVDNDELTGKNTKEAQSLVSDWSRDVGTMGECVVNAISNEQVECKGKKVSACKQNIIQFNLATTFLMIQQLGSSELQEHALLNLKSWISPNTLEGFSFDHEMISKMIMVEVRGGSAGRIKELLSLAPTELKDTESFKWAALATVHCESYPSDNAPRFQFKREISISIPNRLEERSRYSDLCANDRCTLIIKGSEEEKVALELEKRIEGIYKKHKDISTKEEIDGANQENSAEKDTPLKLKIFDSEKEPTIGDRLACLLAEASMKYYNNEEFLTSMTKYLHSLVKNIIIKDPDTLLHNYTICTAHYRTVKKSRGSFLGDLLKTIAEKRKKLDMNTNELVEERKELDK